jgi:acetyltransferase-like isoleucine patch superfamily enzyme
VTTEHSLSRGNRTLRDRVRNALIARVQTWAFGTEHIFPGDPRRRVIHDATVTADMPAVQYTGTDGEPIRIGKYSGVTHTARIFHGGLHRSNWISAVHAHYQDGDWLWPEGAMHSNGPVVIGCDVLVTYEVIIMSGVTIGHGAIVMPRAVVVKDVAPYEIVGGNPAAHIKWRFDEPTREALLRIAWWNWPEDKVRAHRHEIDSPDVAAFIAKHDPTRQ